MRNEACSILTKTSYLFFLLFNCGKLHKPFFIFTIIMWFSGVNVAQQCEYVYLQNSFHLAKLKLITH